MYDAIAKGFADARGEILAYLNSDDLYLPWSVEAAVEALTAGLELVYGDALLFDDATGVVRPHLQLPLRRSYLLTIGSFAQPATWWTRALHDRIGGFDRTLKTAGDLDFYLRATASGRVGRIEEILALMRLHPDMQTVANAERIRLENAEVRRRASAGRSELSAVSILLERARAWGLRRLLWMRLLVALRRPASRGRPWWRTRDQYRFRIDAARAVAGCRLAVAIGASFQPGALVLLDPPWSVADDGGRPRPAAR